MNIQEAALKAIRAGKTHYTPPAGIPELRQAVADHYTRHEGVPTEMAQVVISNGAKHSIHNALMAVCGPGDEVIIPAPYWVSYSDLVKLTGASPVVIETPESAGFKLTPASFRTRSRPEPGWSCSIARRIPREWFTTARSWKPWRTRCFRPMSVSCPTRSTSS